MTLRDECSCGAVFYMRTFWGASLSEAWDRWLAIHANCRGKQ